MKGLGRTGIDPLTRPASSRVRQMNTELVTSGFPMVVVPVLDALEAPVHTWKCLYSTGAHAGQHRCLFHMVLGSVMKAMLSDSSWWGKGQQGWVTVGFGSFRVGCSRVVTACRLLSALLTWLCFSNDSYPCNPAVISRITQPVPV